MASCNCFGCYVCFSYCVEYTFLGLWNKICFSQQEMRSRLNKENAKSDEKRMYIQALGNAGSCQVQDDLQNILKNKQQPLFVRVECVWALRRITRQKRGKAKVSSIKIKLKVITIAWVVLTFNFLLSLLRLIRASFQSSLTLKSLQNYVWLSLYKYLIQDPTSQLCRPLPAL